MFQRRFDNLKLAGCSIPLKLIDCIDKRLGHREKNKYYCYKCGKLMNGAKSNIFHCNNCKTDFDISSYKHKYLYSNSKVTEGYNPGLNPFDAEVPF
jgi:hypothetical protein